MSWKDQLKPASFKGIPFYTDSAQFDFGRTVKIDRPGGSKSGLSLTKKKEVEEGIIVKDLGPREYEIMVKIYFIGDDYITFRKLFETEFMKGGTQVLILPLEDPINVRPSRARRRYSSKEGGIEYIEASFLLSTEDPEERLKIDTSKEVEESVVVVNEAVEDDFKKNFTVEDTAPFVAEEAISLSEKFAETLDKVKGFGELTDDFEDWAESLDRFTLDIAEAIRVPERMVGDILELVEGVEQAFVTIQSAFNSQIALFNDIADGLSDIVGTSDDRTAQRKNRTALVSTIQSASLGQMCAYSSKQDYASKDEALERLNDLIDKIDQLLTEAGSDTSLDHLHDPLSTLRATTVKDMTTRAANLPSVIDIRPPQSIPVIALVYDIYGDLEEEQDLIDRNKIRNPNFCNSPMEVISP